MLYIFIFAFIFGFIIGNIFPKKLNYSLILKRNVAYLFCLIEFKKGFKLSAIKLYRNITNEGLKESKEQIERWFE